MRFPFFVVMSILASSRAEASESCSIKLDGQILRKALSQSQIAQVKKTLSGLNYKIIESKTFAYEAEGDNESDANDGLYHDGGTNLPSMDADSGGNPLQRQLLDDALVIVSDTKKEAESKLAALPAYVLVRGAVHSVRQEKGPGKRESTLETNTYHLILAKVAACEAIMDYEKPKQGFRFSCALQEISVGATGYSQTVVENYTGTVQDETTFRATPASSDKVMSFVQKLPACGN
ncbi:MAG: hypothetical protein ACXVCI_11460 [Bdellovibrionota bacterium]